MKHRQRLKQSFFLFLLLVTLTLVFVAHFGDENPNHQPTSKTRPSFLLFQSLPVFLSFLSETSTALELRRFFSFTPNTHTVPKPGFLLLLLHHLLFVLHFLLLLVVVVVFVVAFREHFSRRENERAPLLSGEGGIMERAPLQGRPFGFG